MEKISCGQEEKANGLASQGFKDAANINIGVCARMCGSLSLHLTIRGTQGCLRTEEATDDDPGPKRLVE